MVLLAVWANRITKCGVEPFGVAASMAKWGTRCEVGHLGVAANIATWVMKCVRWTFLGVAGCMTTWGKM